jgi:hypothetical protein
METVVAGLLMATPAMAENSAAPAGKVVKPAVAATSGDAERSEKAAPREDSAMEMEFQQLRDMILEQSRELEAQRAAMREQQQKIDALEHQLGARAVNAAAGVASAGVAAPVASTANAGSPPNTPEAAAQAQQDLTKKVDGALKNLAGFQFSGDFRFRADVQARSSNAVAGPLQNIRSRYRLRLNVDKELDPRFKFHVQLSTGPLNNGLTNDQDFTGTIAKHPFSVAEAYVDFHPTSRFATRGGRMEEVFADNSRFLWDDDVRFNGFHQIVKIPFGGSGVLELRAGEYLLSNPNVVIVPQQSPFLSAGYQLGQKVRDAALFHPGMILKGNLGRAWGHQIAADMQVYRNPNQIQLASLLTGFPVLVSNGLGISLSGPMTGTGNATTTAGGAIFSAPNFQIAHVAYRLERKGLKWGDHEMPVWLDIQASRNVGTGKLRDAVMASANVGAVRKLGDVRFLYQFAIKDANSLISQFTDDDLGTGTGVNIAVHGLRFDIGLTRFLQWQNLLFIQHERRPNSPGFFVPLQRGANATFRYLGQLALSF